MSYTYPKPTVITSAKSRNTFFHTLGAFILPLNKIRHSLTGYTRPRPFSVSDIQKAIDYDTTVTHQWHQLLTAYMGEENPFAKKRILEIGSGDDLGNALLILAQNAKQYTAFDKYRLATRSSKKLYSELAKKIFNTKDKKTILSEVSHALEINNFSAKNRINYLTTSDFDITRLKKLSPEIIVSNAAFEHFEDIPKTIADITKISKSGTTLCACIDFQTHTRYIRETDPLNIYRYGPSIYNGLRFSGSPNRLMPSDYKEILSKNGWKKITIVPLIILDDTYFKNTLPHLHTSFQEKKNEMKIMAAAIIATKK